MSQSSCKAVVVVVIVVVGVFGVLLAFIPCTSNRGDTIYMNVAALAFEGKGVAQANKSDLHGRIVGLTEVPLHKEDPD